MTTTGLTVVGLPTVPAATGDTTTTGGIETPGRPTTVTTLAAGTTLVLPCRSVTVKLTAFSPAVSEVSVTDASSCRYSSTEAPPVKVSTPSE